MNLNKSWETILSAMSNDGVSVPPFVDTKQLTRYLIHCFSFAQKDAEILIDEADRIAKNAHRQIGDDKPLFQQKYNRLADSIIQSNELHLIAPGVVHVTVGISFMFLCNYYSAGKSIFDSMVSKMRLSGAFKDAIDGLYRLI